MPPLDPRSRVRRAYDLARSVVRREQDRELTQQEFLDVSFGVNPRTNRPYNPRTLRKWLSGERSAARAVEHSTRDTYSFQQTTSVEGQDYGVTLTKPSGRSGLDLWRPRRRADIRRAAREQLSRRAEANIARNRPEIERRAHRERATGQVTIETYRPVRRTRGLRLGHARAVRRERAGVIITRAA